MENHEPSLTTNSDPGKASLYRRRVKHDTNGSTEGPRGEGAGELGADDARVAVRPGDLAPDDPDLGAPLLGVTLVDEGNLLAAVELGALRVLNALDLDEARLRVHPVLATLVAQVATLDVESVSSFRRHLGCVILHALDR